MTKAEKLYHELVRQLDGKSQVQLMANGRRRPNHDRLVKKGNTYIIMNDDESVSVRYHSTIIFTIEVGGRMVLNNGGYSTKSTKDRLNQIAQLGQDGYEQAFTVHQDKHEWYVNDDIPFTDGMHIV